ncbi:MAG: choice-of-anchor D domain-containing protein, partial [Chloroflexota bacterium]|nr:choice-of-anchor D domain-containing protein [Chloroflexota bacterium]
MRLHSAVALRVILGLLLLTAIGGGMGGVPFGVYSSLISKVVLADIGDESDIFISPSSMDFGNVEVGSFVEGVVTVSNLGTADLIIGTVAVSDPLTAPFTIIADNCSGETIAPGGNRTITIRFEPGSIGAFSDSFDIPSNDPDIPVVTVAVGGQGIAADISVSPPSVDFG